MNLIACGEPQKVCVKKDTQEYLILALCVMGGGPERARDIGEVTQHMRGTTKIQVFWVVAMALALGLLGDTGLFPPLTCSERLVQIGVF